MLLKFLSRIPQLATANRRSQAPSLMRGKHGSRNIATWFLLALACGPTWSLAQDADDPFGTGGDSDDAAAAPVVTASASSPALPPDSDLVVQTLRETNVQSAEQYAKAFTLLSRLKRWDEAGRYLDKFAKENHSAAEQSMVVSKSGPAVWVGLASRPELSDAQRQVARGILQSASDSARSPEKLDQLIAQLSSPNASLRGQARRSLHALELVGLQRLVTALIQDEVAQNESSLAAAFLEFGPMGQRTLEALLVSKDPAIRAKGANFLSLIGNKESLHLLLSNFYSTESDESVRKHSLTGIQRLTGGLPTQAESEKWLSNQLRMMTASADQLSSEEASEAFAMTWSDSDKKLLVRRTSPLRAHWNRLDQFAQSLLQVEEIGVDDFRLAVATRMQKVYVDNPIFLDEVASDTLAKELPVLDRKTYGGWEEILELAGERSWTGAQLRILQFLSKYPPAEGFDHVMLQEVARLAADPQPALRYAAISVIAKLDPILPYAGSHRVFESMLEAMRMTPNPELLIVSGSSVLAQQTADRMRNFGFESSQVSTGRALLRSLDQPSPLVGIVIAAPVIDITLGQLVERVAQSRRGSGIPTIVVLEENDPLRRWLSTIPQVHMIGGIPIDEAGMADLLEQIRPQVEPILYREDRIGVALEAATYVRKIAENPGEYSFYELASWENELKSISGKPASMVAGDAILGAMGSGESQVTLAERAANTGLELEERRQAALNLVHSIRTHGVRMSRASVQMQYDRYNQQASKDAAAGELLGWILDAMEARAGLRDWPTTPKSATASGSPQTP